MNFSHVTDRLLLPSIGNQITHIDFGYKIWPRLLASTRSNEKFNFLNDGELISGLTYTVVFTTDLIENYPLGSLSLVDKWIVENYPLID